MGRRKLAAPKGHVIMKNPSLLDSINTAAETILRNAGLLAYPEGNDTVAPKIDLPEQVAAFAAVAKWAELQAKLKPPAPPPSDGKFAALKEQFHGTGPGPAVKRRGSRAPKEETVLEGDPE